LLGSKGEGEQHREKACGFLPLSIARQMFTLL
jgi:hypothetical protein